MNQKLGTQKTGLVLGVLFGGLHLVWSILVALGVAQALQDWVLSLHFLNNPFKVADFNVVTAITLIVFTSVIGYLVGYGFAVIWNNLHQK